MIQFVKGVLFQKNQVPLWQCPKAANIPCTNIDVRGVEWWIPKISGGRLVGYDRFLGNSAANSARPQSDAIKTLRIVNLENNDTLWVVIDTNDDDTLFVSNCNGCCGSTPVMPTVTLPAAIVEECICKDDNGNYVFDFPLPQNLNALNYTILGATVNGTALSALSGSGYSSAAALLSAVSSAYSAVGTWTLTNTSKTLHLVSTTAACVNVAVTLVAKSYCLTLPVSGSPAQVNGIKIGTTLVPFPAFGISADNPQDLINAISQYLIGTVVATNAGAKIQYTGTQVPVDIEYNGVAVSGMTFASGVCS